VLLLDHNPLAIRNFIDIKPDAGQPRLVQAALGACYELMQLRLYIREGGSIDHLVSAHGIRRRLHAAATAAEKAKRDEAVAGKTLADEEIQKAKDDAIEASIQDMWKLACLTYGGAYPSCGEISFESGQRILVVTLKREDERFPGCVLNRDTGVLRYHVRENGALEDRTRQDDVYRGADGNWFTENQHVLYRAKLTRLAATASVVTDNAAFRVLCATLMAQENP
jgi:hypothetical protein